MLRRGATPPEGLQTIDFLAITEYNNDMKQQCEHDPDAATEPGEGETAAVGFRRGPRQSRYRKGRSGDAGDQRRQVDDLVALLRAALDRRVTIVEDGKRRRRSKRELIAAQLVDRSAQADLRATKLLVDLMQKLAAGTPETAPLDEADERVLATFLARLGMAE
jgi:Family of unknown function (DUF5681)